MQIQWTVFPSQSASSMRLMTGSLLDLGTHLASVGPFDDKAQCPWIKLATFGPQRSDKGSYRTNANIVQVHGVEGDYDGGVIQPKEAITLLERHQIRAIVYTSASHTPERPRWRVLAPTSGPMPPAARYALLARVNGALGGVLAAESFVLSQSYYYGEVKGRSFDLLCTYEDPEEGTCIDELDELDNIAMGKPVPLREGQRREGGISLDMFETACEAAGRRLRTGDGRRALLKSYIASRSSRGLLPEEIEGLVGVVVGKYFDPADPPNPQDVLDIVRHFVAKDGGGVQPASSSVEIALTTPGEKPAKEPLFRSAGDLLDDIRPIQWLVNGCLEQDALCMIFGPPASGKSFLAIDIAACVASGLHWHTREVKQGAVFYVAGEGHNGITRRMAAWQKVNNRSLKGVPLYKSTRAVMVLDRQAASDMAEEIARMVEVTGVVPVLVIIDTLARNFGEGDENKQADASKFIEHLDEFVRRRWKCTVGIVHHTGHDADRARGSSVFRGAMDQEISVKPRVAGLVDVSWTKMKDAELPEPFALAIKQVGLERFDEDENEITGAALVIAGDPLDVEVAKSSKGASVKARQVVDIITAGWPGTAPVAVQLTMSTRSTERMLTKMVKVGLLEKPAYGQYKVAEKTIDELSQIGGLLITDDSKSSRSASEKS